MGNNDSVSSKGKISFVEFNNLIHKQSLMQRKIWNHGLTSISLNVSLLGGGTLFTD